MSTDLLPESVNLFLDDFESSLCLPILVVMVLCTAQFVFNHIFGIGYTIYRNIKKPTDEEEPRERTDIMTRLKGMLTTLGIRKQGNSAPIKNSPSPTYDTRYRERSGISEEDIE
ncbi:hypothetical protein P5V15_011047 [Pogonomyrmex californicus]